MFEDWYLNDLFSEKIRDIWKLTDYYLLKLIFNIFDETGINKILKNKVTIEDIIEKMDYSKRVYPAILWMIERLSLDGYIELNKLDDNIYYRLTDKKMDYDLDDIKQNAVNVAPDSAGAFNMLKLMAENYPDFLNGKKTGVDIIFSPDNIHITNDYYRNNLFYNVHNKAGAKILNWDITNRENPVIIEVGGGLGGGTKQFVIDRKNLGQSFLNFTYYFTDIANKMLRTTKKEIKEIAGKIDAFRFQKLDFNKPLKDQGFKDNSVDIIWGVNAVHVANDLRFTLKNLYNALKPGGSLILSETVRPIGNRMIQQELILHALDDYWNVKIDKDIRPRHGFMDWTDWVNALKKIGFGEVGTIPDMNILQKQYDNCYVAVIRGVKK